MSPKKKIIQIEPIHKSVLFAVHTSLDEFRFCESLNQEFAIALQVQSPLDYELVSGTVISHSYYTYIDDYRKLQIDVISNKTDKGVLIDFLDSIYFFIRISHDLIADDAAMYQKRIADIPFVTFVQKIDFAIFSVRQQKQLKQLFF